MDPVHGLNLNRRYISELETEMQVTSSSYGNDFAISFSVEKIERYSVFPSEWLIEVCFLIIIDGAEKISFSFTTCCW
jgi:hypothetical protein